MKKELYFRIKFNPYIGSYYEDCIGFSKTDDAQYIDRKTAQIVASNIIITIPEMEWFDKAELDSK